MVEAFDFTRGKQGERAPATKKVDQKRDQKVVSRKKGNAALHKRGGKL